MALLLETASPSGRFRPFEFPSPDADETVDDDDSRSSSSALVADAIDAVSFRRD